jgi:thiamine biosynthesis protein ThiI
VSLETILVAYGEIALKSRPVRRRLENTLVKHVGSALSRAGFEGHLVLRRYGRLYVEGAPARAAETIARVFGVVSVMPALRTTSEFTSVLELAVEVASERIGEGRSFAVRPKIVGDHPYSSRDLAVEVGSAVLEAMSDRGVYVYLDDPDVTVYIEIRDRDAFVYTDILEGVGGMPYGSQGRLVSLFSGGIDSPVAAWLVMKRGAEVLPLLLDQRPHVGEDYIERARRAFEAVDRYAPSGEFGFYAAPFGKVMSRILESPVPKLRCVLCKRSMYRVAATFADERRALGIVTGESLGQVASQTLHNLYVLDDVVELPVFRPLIGMDKVEIENIARHIGTYGISARTMNGCTVVPDKPATRSRIEDVTNLEEELGLPGLCSEASESIERRL